MTRLVISFACCLLAISVIAQEATPLDSIAQRIDLETVTIGATRLSETTQETPWAVTALQTKTLDLSTQQVNLNDLLEGVPGVFTTNAYNFAQDLRLSIRGFGARSAFGIRGVKILVDGLPESTPDGQGQVDNLDLGLVQQIEVLRGASASLYGNAAGGVVNIQTDELPTIGFLEAGATTGSYGFQRYHIKGGQGFEKVQYLVNASYTAMDGYRAHSQFQNILLSGKLRWWIDPTASLTFLTNYVNSPEAQDPGALTLEERLDDRRQARSRNVNFDSGEQLAQLKLGLLFEKQLGYDHEIRGRLYRIGRDFENRLPFENGGAVALNRNFFGGGINWRYRTTLGGVDYQSQVGVESEWQIDDRVRFVNLQGRLGARTFDQEEQFRNMSAFAIQQLGFGRYLSLRLGGRLDAITMEATDRFLTDGDNSGEQTYTRFNPSIGITSKLTDRHTLYANWSTSFETPVLSERFGNPEGIGGVSGDLEPQFAVNYELGVKGRLHDRVRYELALFFIQLDNELLPFEVAGFPGRTFFRNAGASERQGIELGMHVLWGKGWSSRFSYTYSDFSFTDYQIGAQDFAGKLLPGIPNHQGFGSIRYHAESGLYGALMARYTGDYFADNDNAQTIDSYMMINLRAGYRFSLLFLHAEPFLGINNLTDTAFPGNIRLNAFGGRYFEPGPGLNFYLGVRLRFGEGRADLADIRQ
jgi:iron complex outermembrane receptor protein